MKISSETRHIILIFPLLTWCLEQAESSSMCYGDCLTCPSKIETKLQI